MSKSGKFWDDLEGTFGAGTLTSGYRSQEEQDALVRQGKTRATRSAHTYKDGYDFNPSFGRNEAEVRQKLESKGWTADKILYETGKGKNQGTGAHFHTEGIRRMGDKPTTPSGTPVNSSQPGRGVANPQAFLEGLASRLSPESAASQNVSSTADAIFGSDKELQRRAGVLEGDIVEQGKRLNVLDSVMEAAQTQTMASKIQQVEDTRAISNEIVQGTQELKRQVMPVFQARGRVADQLDKVATMNPLERGFRGIFDLNYDQKFLTSQLDSFDRTLQARAADFDYLNNLHAVGMREIDRRYGLDTALTDLAKTQADEDLSLVGLRIQQSSGMLGALRDRVSTEAQTISAKAAARTDLLSRLDNPTILNLANQAKQTGGTVSHNGVEFSYGELRGQLEAKEAQDLTQEGHRMAVANGRMDLAEGYARNLARSLTRGQAEEAMAAGGVWNGVQLPQDVLNQVWQSHKQVDEQRAQTVANELPAAQALRVGSDSVNMMTGLWYRSKNLLGTQQNQQAATYMTNGTELVRSLIKATQENQPPEVISALTAKIADNAKMMQAQVDQSILQSAGGDKRAAGYIKSFVYGTPMNAGSATEAITYFAIKGSLPEGLQISPEAKQVFSVAQATVAKLRGETNPATKKPFTEQQLQTEVTKAVGAASRKIIGQSRFDRIQASLPQLAKQANHPLGRLNPVDWRNALNAAEVEASRQMAVKLETSLENVNLMRTTGKPIDTTPQAAAMFQSFKELAGVYNAVEQQTLVRELDDLPYVTPGRRNSSVLQDYLASPELHQQASQVSQLAGSSSMGDYFVNPLAVGAVEANVAQWGQLTGQAQASHLAESRATGRQLAAGYAYNPQARMRIILSTIPGVGKDGAEKLMPFIRQTIQNSDGQIGGYSPAKPAEPLETQNTRLVREESLIKDALARTKFDDPAVESFRKVAIRGWQDSAQKADSWMETIHKVLTLDTP